MGRLYWGQPIDEVALLEKCKQDALQFRDRIPSHKELLELSNQHSVEVATVILYLSILNHPTHGKWIRDVYETKTDSVSCPNVLIGIVPGFLYEEFPDVGSGGEIFVAIANRLGIKAKRVTTKSRGLVEENARSLQAWIRNQSEDEIWLFSLSRGSLEVRFALENLLSETEKLRIRHWVNINGFVGGCHLADAALKSLFSKIRTRAACWWLQVPYEFVKQIATDSEICTRSQAIHKKLTITDLVSMPLPQHIPTSLLKRYKWLSQFGPNDSLAVFHHALLEGSRILPLWGEDHFCRGAQMSDLISKMICCLKNERGH